MVNHICENLRKYYPNDSFVAYPGKRVSVIGNLNYTVYVTCTIREQQASKSRETGDDAALKTLFHGMVFECRATKPSSARAMHIFDQITKMLLGRYKSVFVGDTYSDSVVTVYGLHKGITNFKDSKFGLQVTIILLYIELSCLPSNG